MKEEKDYLERHLREVPLFRALLRSVECRLVEALGPFPSPVLDLGCGDGVFASMITDYPVWFGIDPDLMSVCQAQDRGSHSGLIVGEGERLPFPDHSIATVVSNSVLEHIPDLDATIKEIHRVLVPGGRLILTAPSDRFAEMLFGCWIFSKMGLEGWSKRYGDWFNHHSLHYHVDSIPTWQVRLESHGFSIEESKLYFGERTHRVFDIAHYLSLPRLLTYKLTGRWVLFPGLWTNRLFYRWLAPYLDEVETDRGAYLLIEAVKEGT